MSVPVHLSDRETAFTGLATAVAAAALHLGDVAAEALTGARAAGLPEEDADDAAWVLLLARGTPAWSSFTGRAPEREVLVDDAEPDPTRRGLLDLHVPGVARHYHAVRARAYQPHSLSPAQVQVLFSTIGTAIREPGHVTIHARLALEAGADEAQVVTGCAAAIPVAGYGAWLEASRALETVLAAGATP